MTRNLLILTIACSFIFSCGNQSRDKETEKMQEYTLKDTTDIVSAIFSYQDTSGEGFTTFIESSPLDTISFIKNEHYNHELSIPTRKIIKYIPPPEGYPRHNGRSDEMDISFSGFEIKGDSARCVLISQYLNSIGDYRLKNIQGNWKVDEFIDIRF